MRPVAFALTLALVCVGARVAGAQSVESTADKTYRDCEAHRHLTTTVQIRHGMSHGGAPLSVTVMTDGYQPGFETCAAVKAQHDAARDAANLKGVKK